MSDENEAADAGGDKPRFLSGLNGTIAGITSAVIAISALLAAVTNLFGNHRAEPARAIAAPTETAAAANSIAAEADEDPAHYVGTNSDGQAVEVDWDGKHWIYTDPQTSYVYVELTSPDDDMVLAYDREIDGYLRWPIKGGAIEESFKNQLEFAPIGSLRPS